MNKQNHWICANNDEGKIYKWEINKVIHRMEYLELTAREYSN